MEISILAVQARVLLVVGLGWLIVGVWLGYDPTVVAMRAAVAALASSWLAGWLLHKVVGVIEERAAADLAERQLAAERAAVQPAPAPVAARR